MNDNGLRHDSLEERAGGLRVASRHLSPGDDGISVSLIRDHGAEHGEERLGGAVLAHRTPGVHMLKGRDDLAVLWDIRVHPNARRRGVGHLLFEAAASAAQQRQCRLLKVETQNINVGACRFYAREGCQLRGIHPGADVEFPDEIPLLWYLEL